MYTPEYTAERDTEQIHAILRENPFAAVICGEHASHVPLVHDRDRNVLIGHMARPNPHARALDGQKVLAIFTGPHGYVSPTWYANPDGEVPTWSYVAAHVHGTARVLPPEAAIDALHRLTQAMEPDGWRLDPADPRMQGLVRGIIAFEIAIERIEAKRKLNQNKSVANREHLIGELRARGPLATWLADAIATTLER